MRRYGCEGVRLLYAGKHYVRGCSILRCSDVCVSVTLLKAQSLFLCNQLQLPCSWLQSTQCGCIAESLPHRIHDPMAKRGISPRPSSTCGRYGCWGTSRYATNACICINERQYPSALWQSGDHMCFYALARRQRHTNARNLYSSKTANLKATVRMQHHRSAWRMAHTLGVCLSGCCAPLTCA
jgi:hypothetical protein